MSHLNHESSSIAAHVLTNVRIILDRVLQKLNARQLNTCACVCRTWRKVVNKEKRGRDQMGWTLFAPNDKEKYDSCWRVLNNFILESRFEPSLVMVYCTPRFWKISGQKNMKKRKSKITLDNVLPNLPPNCGFQVVVTDGIVGTDEKMKTLEMNENGEALTVLALGNFPGVEFLNFSSPHSQFSDLAKTWCDLCGHYSFTPERMDVLLNKNMKMLNLYCPVSGISQQASYSLLRMFNTPLIAGGFVKDKCLRDMNGHFDSTETSCIVSGMAICGENAKVASVIINYDVHTEKGVEEAMSHLKSFDLPLKRAFGFMYAGIGRGIHVYDRENVESEVFRRTFPNIPLFGFFGYGQIGCEYPTRDMCCQTSSGTSTNRSHGNEDFDTGEERMTRSQKRRRMMEAKTSRLPQMHHSRTSVICLVSLP